MGQACAKLTPCEGRSIFAAMVIMCIAMVICAVGFMITCAEDITTESGDTITALHQFDNSEFQLGVDEADTTRWWFIGWISSLSGLLLVAIFTMATICCREHRPVRVDDSENDCWVPPLDQLVVDPANEDDNKSSMELSRLTQPGAAGLNHEGRPNTQSVNRLPFEDTIPGQQRHIPDVDEKELCRDQPEGRARERRFGRLSGSAKGEALLPAVPNNGEIELSVLPAVPKGETPGKPDEYCRLPTGEIGGRLRRLQASTSEQPTTFVLLPCLLVLPLSYLAYRCVRSYRARKSREIPLYSNDEIPGYTDF